jgi:hypothetical protein
MKRIFMSAHFVMPRNLSRCDTYSRRSAYPGYTWATLEVSTAQRLRAAGSSALHDRAVGPPATTFFRRLSAVEVRACAPAAYR